MLRPISLDAYFSSSTDPEVSLSAVSCFCQWFKQYFICSFICKQIYTTSNVPESDCKLEAYTGHFHFFVIAHKALPVMWRLTPCTR